MSDEPSFDHIPASHLSDRFWYVALQFEEEADAAAARAVIRAKGQQIGGSFTVTHVLIYNHFLVIVLFYNIPPVTVQLRMVAICKTFGAPFVEISETIIADIHSRRMGRLDKLKPISATHLGYHGHDLEVIEHDPADNPPPRVIAEPRILDPLLIQEPREKPSASRAKAPGAAPGSRQKLLIERFYVSCRVTYEQNERGMLAALSTADPPISVSSLRLAQHMLLSALDTSKKYLLDETAIRIIRAIMPEPKRPAIFPYDPLTHLWIELGTLMDMTVRDSAGQEVGIQQIAAFWVMDTADYARSALPRALSFTKNMIAVSLVDASGTAILGLVYWKDTRTWAFPPSHECEFGLCEKVGGNAPDQPSYYRPCPMHQAAIAFLSNFLATTLLAARGDFALEEEPEPLPQIEQTATRKERAVKGKYKERRVSHTFTRLTFDITKKKSKTSSQEKQERTERSGPTWLERAKEEGTVFYWQRPVSYPNGRTLDPERNSRWRYARTVPVRTHPKRIPMSTKRLKNTITKLIATRDPQKEEQK